MNSPTRTPSRAPSRGPSRAPQRAPLDAASRAAQVAGVLRDEREGIDEVTRARMERSLIQAWRTRGAAHVSLPGAAASAAFGRSRSRFPQSRWSMTWAGSLAIAAAAGAVVAYFGALGMGSSFGGLSFGGLSFAGLSLSGANGNVAQFELRIGEAAVQRGPIAEGQVLESGEVGDIEVDLGSARIAMAHGARVRFERLAPAELRVSLATGRIDVDFHPAHKGEQQLVIESRAAIVRVIGTRFSVDADAAGNTEVSVREGVVEVTPRVDGVAQRLAAGQHTYVRADEGDAFERAVRAAIEEQIDTLEPRAGVDPIDALAETAIAEALTEADASSNSKLTSDIAARRLQHARALLREGRHPAARARLRGVSERGIELRYRVEALTLIAESHTAQGDLRRATDAYEQAAKLGAHTPQGDNAQFALARLLERFTHDRDAAIAAYDRYLERAPNGALASQARGALCRLQGGDTCP